jgi:tetratricopeptide (TPR) repeat protein
LRNFAQHKLAEAPTLKRELARTHAEYFANLLVEQSTLFYQGDITQPFKIIKKHYTNIRTAWQWAIKHKNIEMITKMASSLFRYNKNTGHYLQGEKDLAQAIDLIQSSFPEVNILGQLMPMKGELLFCLGEYELANQTLSQALEINRSNNDLRGIGYCLNRLGEIARAQYKFEEAEAFFSEGLEVAYQYERPIAISYALNSMGNLASDQGNIEEAKKYYEDSINAFDDSMDKSLVALQYANLGRVYYVLGEYNKAKQNFLESLKLYNDQGNRIGTADTLLRLGGLYESLGENEEAIRVLKESDEIYHQIGHRDGMIHAKLNLGDFARKSGFHLQAKMLFNEALQAAQEIGNESYIPIALLNLGRVEFALGNYHRAIEQCQLAWETSLENSFVHTFSHIVLGSTYAYLEEFSEAAKHLTHALYHTQYMEAKPLGLYALNSWAEYYQLAGDIEKSLEISLVVASQSDIAVKETLEEARNRIQSLEKELPQKIIKKTRTSAAETTYSILIDEIVSSHQYTPDTSKVIQVGILDDHPPIIDGYKSRLKGYPNIEITASALTGQDLEEILENHCFNLLILDLNVPTSANDTTPYPVINHIPQLVQEYPDMAILVISMYNQRSLIQTAIESGARGYILKDDLEAFSNFGEIIQSIHQGNTYISNRADKKQK